MGIVQSKYKYVEAIAVVANGKIKGTVIFKQKDDYVKIYIDVSGLSNDHKHGFHLCLRDQV
jgi:Cu/Zn superoxide dismutase